LFEQKHIVVEGIKIIVRAEFSYEISMLAMMMWRTDRPVGQYFYVEKWAVG